MDQPGSVVVEERCWETEVSDSILGVTCKIYFFFNLVEKYSVMV